MKLKHLAGTLLLAAFLSACTTGTWMKPDTWQKGDAVLNYFDADGRLAVRVNDKGSYANFDWTSQGSVQSISVNTPLGNTVGELCQDSTGVIAIAANAKRFVANSAEALSQQLMGFPVPLAHLDTWLMGKWVDGEPYRLMPDGSLEQSGWVIRRQVNADGVTPKELNLSNDNLSIRLVLSSFTPTENLQLMKCEAREN